MRKVNIAIAVALCLGVMPVVASAQGPSYESRGYGGPLYVGPNFQQGGQHAPPVYGQGSSKTQRATTQRSRGVKSRKAPATREVNREKSSPAPKPAASDTVKAAVTVKAETENSTISSAGLQTEASGTGPETETRAPPTCKRFIAAIGQTVTVPCE